MLQAFRCITDARNSRAGAPRLTSAALVTTVCVSVAMARQQGFLNPDVDEDDEEDLAGHNTAAFERQYLDDRSWELLKEDEHGRLVASSAVVNRRKRHRTVDARQRIRRGMIRYAVRACCQLVFNGLPCLLRRNAIDWARGRYTAQDNLLSQAQTSTNLIPQNFPYQSAERSLYTTSSCTRVFIPMATLSANTPTSRRYYKQAWCIRSCPGACSP